MVSSPSGDIITTYQLIKAGGNIFHVPTVNEQRAIGPPVEFVPTTNPNSVTWVEGEMLKIKDLKNPGKSICFGALVSLSVVRLKANNRFR